MTIDKAKLKAFAERLVSEHQGGNGDPFPAIGVPAADVLALLAEIDHLTESRGVAREDRNRIGDRHDAIEIERDQLKAENEALRKDAERYRAIRDDIPHIDLGRAILDVQSAAEYDSAVDAAMGKGEQP